MNPNNQYGQGNPQTFSKEKILELITCGIGNCIVEDNLIVCIINPRKLREYLKTHDNILTLNGIPNKYKKQAASYGYNMPIYYIVYNADFSNGLTLEANDKSTISFEHCTFRKGILIKKGYDIRFYASEYYPSSQTSSKCFIKTVNKVNRITFFMDRVLARHAIPKFPGIDITATEIVFDRSDLKCQNIDLCSERLILSESTINANDICIISDSIKTGYKPSSITASKTVIDNHNYDYEQLPNINGQLIYNDVLVDTTHNNSLASNIKIQEQRTMLATRLYQVVRKARVKVLQKSISDILK